MAVVTESMAWEHPENHFRVSYRRKAFCLDVLLPITHHQLSTINFSSTDFEAIPYS
jgi:hypothetical protein